MAFSCLPNGGLSVHNSTPDRCEVCERYGSNINHEREEELAIGGLANDLGVCYIQSINRRPAPTVV